MNFEVNSTNPIVKAVISGTAPRPAQFAAARGILPLPQTDLLEILVALANGTDAELSQIAQATLNSQNQSELQHLFGSKEAPPQILDFFSRKNDLAKETYEAILTNPNTPSTTIINFARNTSNGELLELISFNQQLLIQNRTILEAIISNPYRTAEAERRAQEIKREFFEKERGAKQIANELRARGKTAAAEFIEQADFANNLQEASSKSNLSFEDAILLAEHIEAADSETDDTWLSLEYIEDIYEETDEQRAAIASKILGDLSMDENDEITGERISLINRIMRMNMRDRMKLATKGDREARTILIRDPNRIVAEAVIHNPKITENEVEKIAAMRSIPEEVLRQISNSRQWARNYQIIHNLARNPRTPMANIMTILTRLQMKDLSALSKNRNVSDAVRRQALRLTQARSGR
jgi:hypothetical protein